MNRHTKRQRVYRKKLDSDDEEKEYAAAFEQIASPVDAEDTDEDRAMLGLVRRKMQKRPRPGLAFSKDSSTAARNEDGADGAMHGGHTTSAVDIVTSDMRFTRETGQQVDDGTDKHLMAYIDSKLAQQRQDEKSAISIGETTLPSRLHGIHEQKFASSGKLQEIDLGPGAAEMNAQRTEQARQRLEGGNVQEAETVKPQRVRIGRDGKPMKPRKRFRRRSEDVERDKLVDSLMKEARLEVYERPAEVQNSTGNDLAADERIAEEFRRDFMNQAEDRSRKAPPPPPGPVRGPKGEPDVTKGPKLGGSRSARAAMRAQQEASKKH